MFTRYLLTRSGRSVEMGRSRIKLSSALPKAAEIGPPGESTSTTSPVYVKCFFLRYYQHFIKTIKTSTRDRVTGCISLCSCFCRCAPPRRYLTVSDRPKRAPRVLPPPTSCCYFALRSGPTAVFYLPLVTMQESSIDQSRLVRGCRQVERCLLP